MLYITQNITSSKKTHNQKKKHPFFIRKISRKNTEIYPKKILKNNLKKKTNKKIFLDFALKVTKTRFFFLLPIFFVCQICLKMNNTNFIFTIRHISQKITVKIPNDFPNNSFKNNMNNTKK